ncbi:unnamed protein product [Chilo suppressalis]|uniref:tRNA:m(4)X modification enzyme TRM13 n=1 Tax=Chilo suppressalis TaxID=168631 RepID=A0ABN8AV96_CHISP|nr:unnamed protein product [Chilo suppressalis]
MNDCEINISPQSIQQQCQYFVVRKKRRCRMTVRPGRIFCGEHEPDPKTEDGQKDYRIPCPNDPKHTCYASKLQKHLLVCNARPRPLPPYLKLNVNVPANEEPLKQIILNQVPKETVAQVINKINKLYEKYLMNTVETIEEQEIHETILADFQDASRTESSLRHLRQASSLLRAAERAMLVRPDTCYVELGAGKGSCAISYIIISY